MSRSVVVLQPVERSSPPVRKDFPQRSRATTVHDQRWLARELHDRTLDTWLTDVMDRFHGESGIETVISGADTWPLPLSTYATINLCRIVEEALHNVRLYSGAREVLVTLSHDNGIARLCIRDDGRGRRIDDASAWLGLGTLGMKERAMLLGGELQIESAIGIGTTIVVTLPVGNLTS